MVIGKGNYIFHLEKEIEKQNQLLVDYISKRDFTEAGSQQQYVAGLTTALHLAKRILVATGKSYDT